MQAHRLPRFQTDRHKETGFGRDLFPASPHFVNSTEQAAARQLLVDGDRCGARVGPHSRRYGPVGGIVLAVEARNPVDTWFRVVFRLDVMARRVCNAAIANVFVTMLVIALDAKL